MYDRIKQIYKKNKYAHYHTFKHIENCLHLLETHPKLKQLDSPLMRWAIIFHDHVYDPRDSDNEIKSAMMSRINLEFYFRDNLEIREMAKYLARLIRVTDHKKSEFALDDNMKALLDIDLSILGSEPRKYLTYSKQIRKEYAHVPHNAYNEGRIAVLKSFLNRERIYHFLLELEGPARKNIQNEIVRLSGQF